MRVRLLGGQVAAVLACSGCRAEPVDVVPAPLEIHAPGSSWFEAERLPLDPANFGCVGIIEHGGERLVGAATAEALVLLRPAPSGWSIETIEIEPGRLDDRVVCTAADLDGAPGLEFLIVDGSGGVVISPEQSASIVELPEFPGSWDADPLPFRDAAAGAVGLVDLDDDGRLDLYVARTQDGAAELFVNDGCSSPPSGDVACGDGFEYPGFPDVALLNLGAQEFALYDELPEIALQGQCVGVLDLDDDGRQELISCNDAAYNHVFDHVDGRWEDRTEAFGLDVLNHGMGIAAGDLDGDGRVDLVFSDIGVPLVLFAREQGYELGTHAHGFAPVRQYAWGVAAEDLDNDRDLDLLFENSGTDVDSWGQYICGGVCEYPASESPELLLYRNDGHGQFRAEQATSDDFSALDPSTGGDGMAVGDIDGDGLLDALVIRDIGSQQRELWLLRGRSSEDHGWLEVQVPFGARVRVCIDAEHCRTRELMPASSVRVMPSEWLHFGLGAANSAEVAVEWPRGTTTELGTVDSGTRLRFGR